VASAWVWVTGSFAATSASTCLMQYVGTTNELSLVDDAGVGVQRAAIGGGGILQNSSCAVALGASSVARSGNTLTLNLALSFTPGFSGSKTVFMYGSDADGTSSGWQARGAWTVPAAVTPVTAESVIPHAGTGASQGFALQYSASGASSWSTAWVWINPTFAPTAADSCLIYYDAVAAQWSLIDDGGTAWLRAAAGGSGTVQNSQCSLDLGSSSVVRDGTGLTLNPALTFAPGFSGAKNIYLYAATTGGQNSGWQTRGTWTVPAIAAAVTADSVTPRAGTGSDQIFSLQYSDSSGASHVANAWLWIDATFAATSASSCLIEYDATANELSLIDDAGTGWQRAVLGSGGTLQNSSCAVALGGSSAIAGGNTLTLNLALSFNPSFSGAKTVFIYGAGTDGTSSGWQTRGTWTVP
jgi:hypothetical protein